MPREIKKTKIDVAIEVTELQHKEIIREILLYTREKRVLEEQIKGLRLIRNNPDLR